jgi:hypothetical protein
MMTLLDWCAANGIRIHPNIRILRRDQDKKAIYVRAADAPILPDHSRKPGSLFTPQARYSLQLLLTTSVDISCRNPEIRRAIYPFVCVGRTYPPRAVRS